MAKAKEQPKARKRTKKQATARRRADPRDAALAALAERTGDAMRRERFVNYYLEHLNGAKAVGLAGYGGDPKYHKNIAYQLLHDERILAAIEERQQQLVAGSRCRQDQIIGELARAAFFDVRKIFTETGELKDPSQYDPETAHVVCGYEVEVKTIPTGEGDPITITNTKVKLVSKEGALEKLGKHLGLFREVQELKVAPEAFEEAVNRGMERARQRRKDGGG